MIITRGLINRIITRGYGATIDLTNVGLITTGKVINGIINSTKAGISSYGIIIYKNTDALISSSRTVEFNVLTSRIIDSLISTKRKMSTVISTGVPIGFSINTSRVMSAIMSSSNTINSSILTKGGVSATIQTPKNIDMQLKSTRLV